MTDLRVALVLTADSTRLRQGVSEGIEALKALDAARSRAAANLASADAGSENAVSKALEQQRNVIRARVERWIDGDTARITTEIWPGLLAQEKVRLKGIDAPELTAASAAERLVAIAGRDRAAQLAPAGSMVDLAFSGRDGYGRLLANMTNGGGVDIGARLRSEGLATKWPKDPRFDLLEDLDDATRQSVEGRLAAESDGASRLSAVSEQSKIRRLTDNDEFTEGARKAFQGYSANALNAGRVAEQAITASLSSMTDALTEFFVTGEFKLGNFLQAVQRQIAQMLSQQIVGQLSGLVSGGGGGGGFGSIFGSLGNLLGFGGGGGASIFGIPSNNAALMAGSLLPFHEGGIVGRDGGAPRRLPLALLAGAPRFHLGSDEVPAILQKREGVFTPRQMDNADRLFAALASLAANRGAGGAGGANSKVAGASAGNGAPPTITIINQTGGQAEGQAQVKPGRGQGGGDLYEILIRPRIVADMQTNGPVAQAMRSSMGVRQVGRG